MAGFVGDPASADDDLGPTTAKPPSAAALRKKKAEWLNGNKLLWAPAHLEFWFISHNGNNSYEVSDCTTLFQPGALWPNARPLPAVLGAPSDHEDYSDEDIDGFDAVLFDALGDDEQYENRFNLRAFTMQFGETRKLYYPERVFSGGLLVFAEPGSDKNVFVAPEWPDYGPRTQLSLRVVSLPDDEGSHYEMTNESSLDILQSLADQMPGLVEHELLGDFLWNYHFNEACAAADDYVETAGDLDDGRSSVLYQLGNVEGPLTYASVITYKFRVIPPEEFANYCKPKPRKRKQ